MDTGLQGYRDTRIQGYRATWIQGCRATGIQGYRDTGLQGYRATRIQGYIQGYKDTRIHTGLQGQGYIQGYKDTRIHTGLQGYRATEPDSGEWQLGGKCWSKQVLEQVVIGRSIERQRMAYNWKKSARSNGSVQKEKQTTHL